ncbi:MAG: SUMF1/EgtB/PvdO family nonheme iron enzyme, partial [Planctomycetia bacterium]|nr:SUMF1/EgtB/PvdO family nonheme iron enzyme [Planctomycetia bacterium]
RGAPAFAFDDGFRVTAPVATFEPNPWGLYDMLGNVGEVCGDWYDIDYYRQGSEQDPKGPTSDSGNNMRVVRGGDWKEEAPRVGSAYRTGVGPDNREGRCGFRLAATTPAR